MIKGKLYDPLALIIGQPSTKFSGTSYRYESESPDVHLQGRLWASAAWVTAQGTISSGALSSTGPRGSGDPSNHPYVLIGMKPYEKNKVKLKYK